MLSASSTETVLGRGCLGKLISSFELETEDSSRDTQSTVSFNNAQNGREKASHIFFLLTTLVIAITPLFLDIDFVRKAWALSQEDRPKGCQD